MIRSKLFAGPPWSILGERQVAEVKVFVTFSLLPVYTVKVTVKVSISLLVTQHGPSQTTLLLIVLVPVKM